jgi:hypothetical protein
MTTTADNPHGLDRSGRALFQLSIATSRAEDPAELARTIGQVLDGAMLYRAPRCIPVPDGFALSEIPASLSGLAPITAAELEAFDLLRSAGVHLVLLRVSQVGEDRALVAYQRPLPGGGADLHAVATLLTEADLETMGVTR